MLRRTEEERAERQRRKDEMPPQKDITLWYRSGLHLTTAASQNACRRRNTGTSAVPQTSVPDPVELDRAIRFKMTA